MESITDIKFKKQRMEENYSYFRNWTEPFNYWASSCKYNSFL